MSSASEPLQPGALPKEMNNEATNVSATADARNEPSPKDGSEGEHPSTLGAPAPVPTHPGLVASSNTSRNAPKSKKKKGQPAVTMAVVPSQNAAPMIPGENTGRWTAEEHRLFLQGLEQHGKGWKKIASLIKSRTVVQIRTHAQKYFQKLAKARQNGEEGDITMEGRGGTASVTSNTTATAAQTNKRRRQITGTKRKAIQSIVASAQRQAKKNHYTNPNLGDMNKGLVVPGIAPALAHFVMSNQSSENAVSDSLAQEHISGPALEDSLFRFLTPVPIASDHVNEVARQAGANPITLPSSNSNIATSVPGSSPTGVQELAIYPSWTDAKDPPSWYAKGADVDALLDVSDTLDWLADTGDLDEEYQPESNDIDTSSFEGQSGLRDVGGSNVHNTSSVSSLPHVDSNMESVVPPLPALFEGNPDVTEEEPTAGKDKNPSAIGSVSLHLSPSDQNVEHLGVFDSPMEEQEFVSTLLETTAESSDNLAILT